MGASLRLSLHRIKTLQPGPTTRLLWRPTIPGFGDNPRKTCARACKAEKETLKFCFRTQESTPWEDSEAAHSTPGENDTIRRGEHI